MDSSDVILVMLRQPTSRPNEMRTDPLWEFGSFGCTGCHRRNLMNLKKLMELDGARLGFVQNGPLGVKLVHVTPPVKMREHGSFGEAKWSPAEMPLKYESAPVIVDNDGQSDFPELLNMLTGVDRKTRVAQFASKFRSRREALPPSVGRKVIKVYDRFRRKADIAKSYVDALPWAPPLIDRNRRQTYRKLLGIAPSPKKAAGSKRC